jgi:hypothetical protein
MLSDVDGLIAALRAQLSMINASLGRPNSP